MFIQNIFIKSTLWTECNYKPHFLSSILQNDLMSIQDEVSTSK